MLEKVFYQYKDKHENVWIKYLNQNNEQNVDRVFHLDEVQVMIADL